MFFFCSVEFFLFGLLTIEFSDRDQKKKATGPQRIILSLFGLVNYLKKVSSQASSSTDQELDCPSISADCYQYVHCSAQVCSLDMLI